MDEKRQEIMELQRKLQEIVQQIQVVERQGMAHAQEVRRAALVGAELQGVPEDVQLYQSVGKAYISTTKASVMEANDQARVESTKAIEQLKATRDRLVKEKESAEVDLRELAKSMASA